MEENSITKVIAAVAFIALAGVSCWATQQSLCLSLSSWPQILCWLVTIAFFIIASWGTKLITDSLDQNIYMEGKGVKLISGILIVLFFWLLFSMPTNTHTFFYRSAISGKVNSDITTTKGYLDQLKNNTVTEEKIQAKCNQFDAEVKIKLAELEGEIKNDANSGFGPKAKEILREFAALLDVANVKPLSYKGTSIQDRQRLVDSYRTKIFALADAKKANIRVSMLASNVDVFQKQALTDWTNLDLVEKAIVNGNVDLNNSDDINEVNKRLAKSYATIKNYAQYIHFNGNDEAVYTAENQVTKVKRMLSVWDVWIDFVRGEYAGHGLIYWVLLSVLVDVGAFVFFGMFFKNDDY